MRKLLAACALLSLGACSSIVEGTNQTLAIDSNPQGAECTLTRTGQSLGKVTTPGQVLVSKSRNDITVRCAKTGHQDGEKQIVADAAAATFGNIIAGGVVGVIVDQSTGASFKYETNTVVTLEPVAGGPVAQSQ